MQPPVSLELLETPIGKYTWKNLAYKSVDTYLETKLKDEAKSKSSLRYLNVDNVTAGKVHNVWKFAGTEPMSVTKTHILCKILLGLYILQSNRHKFNQYEVEPTFPLCRDGAEDQLNFIVTCTALQYVRQPFMQTLNSVLELEQLFIDYDSDLL